MFNLSPEEVKKTLENYEKILDRIDAVADEIGFLTQEYDYLESEKTEFDGENVIVTACDSHYDLYDCTSGKFPISFLFEDASQHKDWYEKKRQKEKEAYEKERQQLERERELRELQRLQEKYQSESEA